ncbi:hypothetical protein E3P99_03607 [Wallemia hederae]|uniref:Golgi to ER traffic protein 4 n=1 Tax=Wallemia hederae TaxID=1540922 RepID=A0A4T0FF79_9BASI|nr:hypothetical protein E3P99_03607 [Wallemia hederae]
MIEKPLKTILPLLDSGDHYGAHQRTRTAAARLARNGVEGQKSAIELLYIVSRSLLEKSEWGSGVDVSVMMIDAMSNLGGPWQSTDKTHVTQLIGLCSPLGTWRKKLIGAAVTASGKAYNAPSGHPDILDLTEYDFILAEQYLLLASTKESASTLAKMYIQWQASKNQYDVDIGRFALRGVLGYVLAEQIECAITFIINYLIAVQSSRPDTLVDSQPLDGLTLTNSHTLNFAQLVVACIQRSRVPNIAQEWKSLIEHYRFKSNIIGSVSVTQACTEIGALYFDIGPASSGGNMMDLMSSLLGGASTQKKPKSRLAKAPVGDLD